MKPRVIMVDEQDNIIGHKPYREIDFPHEIYRVSRLWVTDSAGNILLQKRSHNVTFNAGLWACAVGGTNDEGETYESNIIKEAQEEIGLVVQHPNLIATLLEQDAARNIFCRFFSYQMKGVMPKINFDPHEVADVRWFFQDELKELLKTKSIMFAPEVGKIVENLVGRNSLS